MKMSMKGNMAKPKMEMAKNAPKAGGKTMKAKDMKPMGKK